MTPEQLRFGENNLYGEGVAQARQRTTKDLWHWALAVQHPQTAANDHKLADFMPQHSHGQR